MERYYVTRADGSVFGTPIKPAEGVNYTTDINSVVILKKAPQKVSNLKFRLALIQVGILPSNIDLAIESMPSGSEKELIFTLWNYANYFERNDEKLVLMASSMSIESEQLDTLFILADSL